MQIEPGIAHGLVSRQDRQVDKPGRFPLFGGTEDLVPGFMDIPEPTASCEPVDPQEVDLVLVPGVAFDRQGNRLGYGGGYYDRFLQQCAAPRVALAFATQLVDHVPTEPHDLRVHAVVTDEEVIRIEPTGP